MGSLAPPIISFIALILVLLPIRWHWRTKNIATLALALWLAEANLFAGISTIAWRDNVEKKLVPFCNIGTSLQTANIFALVAAAMCTLRNLERMASPRVPNNGAADIRRRKMFDFLWCGIFPFIFSGMQYIITPNQFNIYEGVGCQPHIRTSWPAIFIWYTPPIILGTTTFTYAILTFQWLLIHRGQFHKALQHSNPGMHIVQFLRLLALALILASYALGFSLYQLSLNSGYLQPWVSWDYAHSGFSQIGQFPAAVLPDNVKQSLWIFWSIYPSAAILFFVLFGLNGEAMRDWEHVANWAGTGLERLAFFKGRPPPVPPKDDRYCHPTTSTSKSKFNSVSKHTKTAAERWAAGDDLDFVDSDTDDENDNDNENDSDISYKPSQRSFDLAPAESPVFDIRHSVQRK